jgi:hypothetical protein
MSCPNLRAVFERLIRYLLILSDALTMTMSEESGGYRVTFIRAKRSFRRAHASEGQQENARGKCRR